MKDLNNFQAPIDGEITLCEVDGRVHSMNYEYSNVNAFTSSTEKHPKIHITRDMLHPVTSGDDSKALFLPVELPFFKQLIQLYHEHGAVHVLQALANHQQFVLSKSASILLRLVHGFNKLKSFLNAGQSESCIRAINDVSETRNWAISPVRCIAWHPHSAKIAVATSDDSVRIYSHDAALTPILKCKQQRNISCLAWRPLSNSEIAVGCENGIFLWNVDPNSVVTRPSINNAILLQRIDHKPIASLAWGLNGDILASAAACDSAIIMWNVELDCTSYLKRPGISGNTIVKWSPDGNKLFSASTGLVFRIWGCLDWRAERWNILAGRVQAACWSPCGTTLLFTTTEEPVIYGLSFINSDLAFANTSNSSNVAVPLYDLSRTDIDGMIVGGIVQSMDWEPKGHHLAVLFQDTNYIAVFTITTQPVLQLNPGFLINGLPEEVPNVIAFQKQFQYGACLSIGWSSGRLQHFPIVYSDIHSDVNSVSRTSRSFYNTSNVSLY